MGIVNQLGSALPESRELKARETAVARTEVRGPGSREPNFAARGYVLLETVIATGMLLVGMAVIGAQVQDANTSLRAMNLRMRAMMLAEIQLAELDLGLVRFDELDELQEEDFGPRFRDWGWQLTIQETAVKKMYQLRLDVLYAPREEYEEDGFDFENAETLHTVYAMRPTPQPLNLVTDFGLTETQAEELGTQLGDFDLDPTAMFPTDIPSRPVEELVPLLASILAASRIPLSDLEALIPPEVRQALEQSGLSLEGLLSELAGEEGGAETGQQDEQETGSEDQDEPQE